MSFSQIKYAVRKLSLGQLRKLDEWLHEMINRAEEAQKSDRALPLSQRKLTVAEQIFDNKTYRLEGVRCGKENCKCARGKLHGPYWYSYTRVRDKVTSSYIGKSLPESAGKKLRDRT